MKYPGAIWDPGPLDKQGYPGLAVNARRGVVCHSMVGPWSAARGELFKPERRASWHFSVLKNGTVYQHYEAQAVCWHAGTAKYNGIYIGIEHEGGGPGNESEPLTMPQLTASVNLVRWLSQRCPFPLVRHVGLWEHNQLSQTACPSNRIPWDRYFEEEDDMAMTMVACGDSPTGYRVYVLGGCSPTWIANPVAANELIALFGQPKPVSWATLKTLGAE